MVYAYDPIQAMGIFLAFILAIICIVFAFDLFKGTRSKKYRELMVDMYVVGMIKKFATEDELDLIKELKEFSIIEKKAKISTKGLSYVIEDELKEKVAKVAEEKLEKK
jgi:hypothetical protein